MERAGEAPAGGRPRLSPSGARAATAAAVALLVGGAVLVAWHGLTSVEPGEGYDARAHIEYAEVLRQGRLPVEEETYEYASPPAFHWLAIQAQRLVEAVGDDARGAMSASLHPVPRLVWLALLVCGVALLAGSRDVVLRLGGALLVLVAVAAALLHAAAVAAATPWLAGQAVSALALAGLLLVTWWIAKTAWPGRLLPPLLVLGFAAALPITVRLGTMFHPEMLFALLGACAVAFFLRGAARGWGALDGALLGVVLALAALTRQTALVLAAGLLGLALLAGRRRALGFAAAACALLLLVAGPWWLEQTRRYGNPIQSNLEREGYMLERQPRSFYVSLPLPELITHPYRPEFDNELLPKFHADLWSDWFGGQHGFWAEPRAGAGFFASTQSALGLAAAALALLALALLGRRALTDVAGGRGETGDVALAAALVLAALTWVAFVVTLVRFPQEEGDPIKSSYMLFLAPLWALAAVAGADRLARRSPRWRVALLALAGLYAASYAGFLATSW